MTKYIIVKYADYTWMDGKAPIQASVFGTHTANACDIEKGGLSIS